MSKVRRSKERRSVWCPTRLTRGNGIDKEEKGGKDEYCTENEKKIIEGKGRQGAKSYKFRTYILLFYKRPVAVFLLVGGLRASTKLLFCPKRCHSLHHGDLIRFFLAHPLSLSREVVMPRMLMPTIVMSWVFAKFSRNVNNTYRALTYVAVQVVLLYLFICYLLIDLLIF